jgi:hypothetical protein
LLNRPDDVSFVSDVCLDCQTTNFFCDCRRAFNINVDHCYGACAFRGKATAE